MTKGFQQQIHALLVRQCPCNRAYLAGITYAYVISTKINTWYVHTYCFTKCRMPYFGQFEE